jgi:prefoldin subunit 5
MDMGEVVSKAAEFVSGLVSGGMVGVAGGYQAQKRAAKSEAVTELQTLKNEYKEFAEFTKSELELSKQERKDCQKENEALNDHVHALNVKVNELTMAMHNIIGTPKDIRK